MRNSRLTVNSSSPSAAGARRRCRSRRRAARLSAGQRLGGGSPQVHQPGSPRGRRGSARPRGPGARRRPGTHRRCGRPASWPGCRPHARSDATAALRSASIWACACSMIRSASACALLARLLHDLGTLLAGLLADLGGLVLGVVRAAPCSPPRPCARRPWPRRARRTRVRIASWRAVIALLIGGMRYFPKIQTRIANASSSTRKVPLGTRKLLASGMHRGDAA